MVIKIDKSDDESTELIPIISKNRQLNISIPIKHKRNVSGLPQKRLACLLFFLLFFETHKHMHAFKERFLQIMALEQYSYTM